MRAPKKSPLKTDKKSSALSSKRGKADYTKKAALLEDAIAQMNAGKYGRSSAVLKELLALDPFNLEARRLFATLHLRLGSLLPARQAFEALANEALERQDYWLAESLLREYLVAGPRCVPFIEKLGIVYQEKGDELAAAEEFGKAIDILLEDPDTEHPNKPAYLYAKIREVAPASPPAFRLAAFFDTQTGQLIARSTAAESESFGAVAPSPEVLETPTPTASEVMPDPASGVMPWDRVEGAMPTTLSTGQGAVSGEPQVDPLPNGHALGRIEAEPVTVADFRSEYSADPPPAAVAEPLSGTVPEAPEPYGANGSTVSQGAEKIADSVTAPMPWEQVQEATVTILHPDESGGIETRSPSSVDAESPFVALSDSAQVEPQAGNAFAGSISDSESVRPDQSGTDFPQEGSVSLQAVWEPASIGDANLTAAGLPADAPESGAVEPRLVAESWEPAQEPAVELSDSLQESVQREDSFAAPLPAVPQMPSWGDEDHQESSSDQSNLASFVSEVSRAEEPVIPSTVVVDAATAELPPLPEKTETPKSTGFSWESIFSTWKYGPSSSAAKAPIQQNPVEELREKGTLPPHAEPSEPVFAYEVRESEAPVPVPTPAQEIPIEPAASAIVSEQAQEVPATNPSMELPESGVADSAEGIGAVPASVLAEALQYSAPAVDQPEASEAIVLPSTVTADGVDPLPDVEPVAQRGGSNADPVEVVVPARETMIEVETSRESSPQEESRLAAASPEALEQPEGFQIASVSETISLVSPDAMTLPEAPRLPAASSEPAAQPEAFRFISPGDPASADVDPEIVAGEATSPPAANSEPSVQPEEFWTPSWSETNSSTVMPEDRDHSEAGPEPTVQPEPREAISAEEPAALSEETVPVNALGVNRDERPAEVQTIVPLPLIHETRLASEPPAYGHVEEPKERPVAFHGTTVSEPDPRAADLVGQSEVVVADEPAASPVASAVDALFQSSRSLPRTDSSERTSAARPRPRVGAKLARLRLTLSAFIGSCFSTTQALIMSLVGLVILVGALAAIAIGAVGMTWIIMEEKPSPAFQRLTTAPQRPSMDSRKNGYMLLLGFDAEAGADPMQAGYERKPSMQEDGALSACVGGTDGHSGGEPLKATASVAEGWFRSPNPVAQLKANADGVKDWIGQAQSSIGRYRQWLKMPFEDGGYGQAVAPPCAAILFAHRLYIAEGFIAGQSADAGIQRLKDDMEAWRTALGQAKTLPVKVLAVQALQDDLAVASGLLVQPDFNNKDLPALTAIVRPLDQVESSMRWPMQSELAAAGPATDAQLKGDHGDDVPWHVLVAKWLPLPKQRRLNEYAAYYDASANAAGEGRYSAMPKRAAYIKNPPATVLDYLTNPIENIVGLKPLSSWEQYNGIVIDIDARLRLASVQAWLRRGSQEGDLVTRIAKAGQRFYDPYTGMPMLVNLKRGAIYSVGRDGKDQDADPQQDVAVSVPLSPPVSGSGSASSGSAKPK